MTVPTTAEQLLLDTHPQRTDLYLSIFEPTICMVCQITGSYDSSTQSIGYINGLSGTSSDVVSGYVAMIGTSSYDDSLGRTYVRYATATDIRFIESDHIDWASATYVTILKYIDIYPLFPRIIQNPANEEDVIFYKVYDIAYTNQNSILGSFVNMGSNYAGFIESNGTGTCYWTASGTANLLGDNLTYSWMFEGATITGSTLHTPGYVAYTNPGHFTATLKVTSASGRVDSSTRYVSFYDRPGSGNKPPILNFEIADWGGSRDGIGYSCRIRIRENVPKSTIIDNALVVIFGEDWYGTTKQSVSNNALGREGIKFVGYIDASTIQYNYADGWVEFECVSPTKFMELCECFSCSVESKTNPTTWYELLNMDIRRAIYHYLAWQSSVLRCCDVEFKNFTDRYIQYFDADRTSLYEAINSLVSSSRGGKVVSDSLGKIWIEQEPDVLANATTTLPTVLSITKKDWIGQPIIDERQHQETSFIELGGIAYEPVSNTFAALLSDAPGVAPAYRGKADGAQGWALLDQDELNTIVGNKYAFENSRYPNIELNLRGYYNNVDIAPQEKIALTIASGDTPRNIVFSNKAFVIRSKDMSWNSRSKVLLSNISVAELTSGFAGTTIIIPDAPPDDGDDGGTYDTPPVQTPPLPTPTVISLAIYHNDVFVGNATALNFLDGDYSSTGTL